MEGYIGFQHRKAYKIINMGDFIEDLSVSKVVISDTDTFPNLGAILCGVGSIFGARDEWVLSYTGKTMFPFPLKLNGI